MDRRLMRTIEEANWVGELAGRAYLDGHYHDALVAADRSVLLTRQILRRMPDDQRALAAAVDRYRWRACTHEQLGNLAHAIDDAQAAIVLCARREDPGPLEVPLMRLLQCELHAELGHVEVARAKGTAIEAYRRFRYDGDVGPVAVAEGFSRYGAAMALIGDLEEANQARRAGLAVYRAWRGKLWSDHRTRFVRTVTGLVEGVEPPDAATAPEVLPMMWEAVEELVPLIRPAVPSDPDPAATEARRILAAQSRWLDALGARQASAEFARVSRAPDWIERLPSLHDLLERALAPAADPEGTVP
ncbi:hypothetical protein ABZ479_39320 [Streptomyces sp. NPDC005722]